MARYRDIANELRERITNGEFPVGTALPPIADLQAEYDVAGLNTIRQAQRLLANDGLVEPRQGVGVYVISLVPSPPATTLLGELKITRAALDRSIALLERAGEN